jgi:hypothetical protein
MLKTDAYGEGKTIRVVTINCDFISLLADRPKNLLARKTPNIKEKPDEKAVVQRADSTRGML